LHYTLARPGAVDLAIVDLQGRRVRTLVHSERPAGASSVKWDGRDAFGVNVANGLYFARLVAPGERAPRVQKITLAR
jgi:flagellar hook assembly protein FlgD